MKTAPRYQEAGVDIDLERECSKIMQKSSQKTLPYRDDKPGEIRVLQSGFQGENGISMKGFDSWAVLTSATAEIPGLADRGRTDEIMYFLLAKLFEKAHSIGATPIAATNIIEVDKLNKDIFMALGSGLEEACKDFEIAMVGGEIAQLPEIVSGPDEYNFNLSATLLSYLNPPDLMIPEVAKGYATAWYNEYLEKKAKNPNHAMEFELASDFVGGMGQFLVEARRISGYFLLGTDGVGSKVLTAQLVDERRGIATDLFAMLADDASRWGAVPLALLANLDVKEKDEWLEASIRNSFLDAFREYTLDHKIEIHELGDRISGYGKMPFNLHGALLSWLETEEGMLGVHKIKPGDEVILLQEPGTRSNGHSLIRQVFSEAYGDEWHEKPFEGTALGRAVLAPSIVYEGYPGAKAMVHFTGGGVPEKFGRFLGNTGLGVRLDPFEMPPIMLEIQRAGNLDAYEMYESFNAGQGMAVVTDDPSKVYAWARKIGHEAKKAGEITSTGHVTIENKSLDDSLQRLTWRLPGIERR